MSELWMPGAEQVPGHSTKVGYPAWGDTHAKRGDVKHSAEGWKQGLINAVQDPNRRASWHFSVLTDGKILQHYQITANCWHGGDVDDDDDVRANIELVGIEHEGIAGQLLTPAQIDATARISVYCAETLGQTAKYTRFPEQHSNGWTLVEHNQVSNSPTACPSNRIPWAVVLDTIQDMTKEDDGMEYKNYEDSEGFWLVCRTKEKQVPVWRRKYPHVPTQNNLREEFGEPLAVGEGGGAYTQGQFNSIPVID